MFQHLKCIKQNYLEHFIDAISYSFMSLKASFYFCIHAIWPDIFIMDGSKQIEKLNEILIKKKHKLNI